MDLALLRDALLNLLLFIVSLTLHEWGHAYAADKLGDATPRAQGRVTLNPLAHIDWIGTVAIPFAASLGLFGNLGFIGWAKPVMINPANLRPGYWKQAIVTLAGPAMNLGLAIVAAVAWAISAKYSEALPELFGRLMWVNVGLMCFNLVPIPPLDGSKFFMYFRLMREETYWRIAQWGWVVLLIAINFPPFRQVLGTIIVTVGVALMSAVSWI
jgi:Zn-dependent protease